MKNNRIVLFYTIIWSLLFLLLGSRVISWGKEEIFIRGFSQWMDYPVHLAFSRSMENLFPWEILKSHPYFSWTPFNYYFIPDLLVTFLLKLHLRFDWALLLPTVFAFIIYIHQKTIFLFQKKFSLLAILFSDLLFLFLGGLGFAFFALAPDSFGVSNNLELSSFYVTIQETLYSSYYSNPLAGQFFSAKNIIFGLAIFFSCLNLLENKRYFSLFVCVLLFPFIHAHTFVLFLIWSRHLLFERKSSTKKDYIWFILTSALCFVVLKLTLLKYSGTGFLHFRFGWRTSPLDFETYKVMFLGTGVFWPLALYSFYKFRHEKFLVRVASFSLIVLALTHFIQWQPNIWDNIKIYNMAHLFASISVACCLSALWNQASQMKKIFSGLLLFSLVLNGVLENYFIFLTDRHAYPLITRSDIQMSEEFQKKYKSGKVYYENFHHHWYPVLLGKNIALGFKYNLWTWGVPYQSYLQELSPLLRGGGGSLDLQRLGIHYVIASKMAIFPSAQINHRTMYPEKARHVMPFFYVGTGDVPEVSVESYRLHFPVLLENEDWVIFDVTKNLQSLNGKGVLK